MEAPSRAKGRFAYRADMREFSFTRRSVPLREALARITALAGREDAPTAAIQMLPLAEAMPDFVAQKPMPLLSADIGPKLWRGGAGRTPTHHAQHNHLACGNTGRRPHLPLPT